MDCRNIRLGSIPSLPAKATILTRQAWRSICFSQGAPFILGPGRIAQLVEHISDIDAVAGSTPASSTRWVPW